MYISLKDPSRLPGLHTIPSTHKGCLLSCNRTVTSTEFTSERRRCGWISSNWLVVYYLMYWNKTKSCQTGRYKKNSKSHVQAVKHKKSLTSTNQILTSQYFTRHLINKNIPCDRHGHAAWFAQRSATVWMGYTGAMPSSSCTSLASADGASFHDPQPNCWMPFQNLDLFPTISIKKPENVDLAKLRLAKWEYHQNRVVPIWPQRRFFSAFFHRLHQISM